MKLTDNMVRWSIVFLVAYLITSFSWVLYKGHHSYYPRLIESEAKSAKLLAEARTYANTLVYDARRTLRKDYTDFLEKCYGNDWKEKMEAQVWIFQTQK